MKPAMRAAVRTATRTAMRTRAARVVGLAVCAWACAEDAPSLQDIREARLARAAALIDQCAEAASSQTAAQTVANLGPYSTEGRPDQYATAWLIDDRTACYDGVVTAAASAWFEALDRPLSTLVIRSQGGNGAAGVVIGELLNSWNTELVVREHCYSACASFMFTAAPRRTVPEPGLVGWHQGGLVWTRFEALQTPQVYEDPALRPLARHAAERFRQSGRTDVPDAVWNTLPDAVRGQLDAFNGWRPRIKRLYNHAGLRSRFESAHTIVRARAHEFAGPGQSAMADGADLIWAPGEDELQPWGFQDVVMWDGVPQAVQASSQEVLVLRIPADPALFPVRPQTGLPDDSAHWPAYAAAVDGAGDDTGDDTGNDAGR